MHEICMVCEWFWDAFRVCYMHVPAHACNMHDLVYYVYMHVICMSHAGNYSLLIIHGTSMYSLLHSDSDSEMFLDRNVTSATYKLVFSNVLRTYNKVTKNNNDQENNS